MASIKNFAIDDQSSEQLCAGLAVLAQAYRLSVDSDEDAWQFAVEIETLCRDGELNVSLCRWLICNGYAEHADEVTKAGDDRRHFINRGRLSFSDHTCFVITHAGLDLASDAQQKAAPNNGPRPVEFSRDNGRFDAISRGSVPPLKPTWDGSRHELLVLGKLVKRFKHPSPNQELILQAFEEENWPSRIDDPIPPHPDLCPKRRLNDTIKSLNSSQKNRLLRFKGDGTGRGVLWELVIDESD